MKIKYCKIICLSLIFYVFLSVGYGQNSITKADFLNKSANIYMENIPKELHLIAEKIEPDGAIKIKKDK